MAFELSETTRKWLPSATLGVKEQITKTEKELQALHNKSDYKIVVLTAGQPHFKPTDDVIAALSEGGKFTPYQPVSGYPELKSLVAEMVSKQTGNSYAAENVQISVGGKEALYHVFGAITNEGDVFFVPAPYWVSIPTQIESFGGKVAVVEPDEGLKISAESLEDVVKKAKGKKVALYLNSPSNPTGMVYSKEELEAIAKVCKKHGLNVVSDECYTSLTFDGLGVAPSIASLEGMAERTVIIGTMSKQFCAPSYRVGWAVGPKELISGMNKRQADISSGTSMPAMFACCVGLKSAAAKARTEEMVEYYEKARDNFISGLSKITVGGKHAFKINQKPQGAFYLFPDVSAIYGKSYEFNGQKHKINGSEDCQLFFMRSGVACVNGKSFGRDKCVRFSYATTNETLALAVERLKEAIGALK